MLKTNGRGVINRSPVVNTHIVRHALHTRFFIENHIHFMYMNQNEELQNGALIDLRSQEEKDKDIQFGEVVASATEVIWVEKSPDEWRSFPIFNQGNSGSCVAQTLKKMLGVYVWIKTGVFVFLSASHIYKRRKNKPAGGMGGADALQIAGVGTTLEQFAPSEKMSDAQMDNVDVKPFMEKIGEIFKIGKPVVGPIKDIETVASIIQQTEKAVMVWFYFSSGKNPKEWVDVPRLIYPDLDMNATTGVARHSVAAVDFCLWEGKKALIIEDSWGGDTAIEGRRVITEEFFNARNWYTAHFMNFAFEEQSTPKPHYDGSVKSLQDCLRHYGTFPSNVDSTGFFGTITKQAVNDFQVKEKLHATGTGTVGPLTKARLLELYP